MRYLGIDFGDKKTGLAVGDSKSKIASPFDVIKGGDDGITEIQHLVLTESIDALVLGVPQAVGDFHSSEQLEKVREFEKHLHDIIDLPIYEVDESLTSAEAIRLQKEEGAKAQEDALSAMILLQAFLDEKGNG